MTFLVSKFCNGCKQDKPVGQWAKHKKLKDGLQTMCKACMKEAQRRRHAAMTPDERAWRYWTNRLWTDYRLRPEDYHSMLEEQQGKCAVCGDPMKRPCIDHIKGTKRVRALLCNQCNAGLGQFHDDVTRLKRAVAYLEKHHGNG